MFDFLSKKDRTPPALPEGTERRRYTITGQVQGVGFRYRARYAAQILDLTGWVQNEDDGSVTLEVQGDPDKFALFYHIIFLPQHLEGGVFHPQGMIQQAGDGKSSICRYPGGVEGVEVALGQVFRVGGGGDARHAYPVSVGAAGGNVRFVWRFTPLTVVFFRCTITGRPAESSLYSFFRHSARVPEYPV